MAAGPFARNHGRRMRVNRFRLYMAGLVAFLIGMPLTQKAYGSAIDIFDAALYLGLSIARASDAS